MNLALSLQGIMYGFTIGMVVGPIGILCIRTTLARGFFAGISTGLGAAAADAVYGAIAGLGFSAISCFLIAYQSWLHLFGGLFLLYLGIKTFQSPITTESAQAHYSGIIGLSGTTFVLTLANPTTILTFIALFSGLDISSACTDLTDPMLFVLGVFAGSMIWWIILSSVTSYLRYNFSETALVLLNSVSGTLIFCFGLWSLTKLFLC